jgi:hypothetical protein
MKKVLLSSLAVIGLFAFATSSTFAAADDAKEMTIKGEGKCGKCSLKETAACQNVIEVSKGKKKGTYYLVQNDVSKKFHDNICKETKNVKATGTLKKVDGKNEFTASKIEVVEK